MNDSIGFTLAMAVLALVATGLLAVLTVRTGRSLLAGRAYNPLTAVAVIGTVVAMGGVGHAMYDALAPDRPGLHVFPLAEALVAALFLELVVATCARRARSNAADARAARLDVAVVLLAATLSGVISALHVGVSVGGLFRLAVPPIAAIVWLGDIVSVLRTKVRDDHEQRIRRASAAVGRHILASETGSKWRIRFARRSVARALHAYISGGGDRVELVERLEDVHHAGDLLSPLGRSPWRVAARSERPTSVPATEPLMLRPVPMIGPASQNDISTWTVPAINGVDVELGRYAQALAPLAQVTHLPGRSRALPLTDGQREVLVCEVLRLREADGRWITREEFKTATRLSSSATAAKVLGTARKRWNDMQDGAAEGDSS